MIDFLAAAIISASDIDNMNSEKFETELSYHERYISFQLETHYSEEIPTVSFIDDIPARFHDRIRKDAELSGWCMSIEGVQGFENYNKYYKFTFTRM